MRAILTALTLAAIPIATAYAEPEEIRIPVSRSELQTEQGLANVMAKVEKAAKTMCVDHSQPLMLRQDSECRKATVRDALDNAQIGELNYYYASIHGEKLPNEPSSQMASR